MIDQNSQAYDEYFRQKKSGKSASSFDAYFQSKYGAPQEGTPRKFQIDKNVLGGSLLGDFGKGILNSIKEAALGPPEALVSSASGMAAFPISKVAQLGATGVALAKGESEPFVAGQEAAQKTADFLTYKPTTEFGKTLTGVATSPFAALGEGVGATQEAMGLNPEAKASTGLAADLALLGGVAHGIPKTAKAYLKDTFKKLPVSQVPMSADALNKAIKEVAQGKTETPQPPVAETPVVKPWERGFIDISPKDRGLSPSEMKVVSTIRPDKADVLGKTKEVAQHAGMYLWDRFDPWRKWTENIEKLSGKKIPMGENPYWELVGYGGREGVIESAYYKLQDIIQPIRKNYQDFEQYLYSMRNLERANHGIPNPGGITAADAAQSLFDMRKRLGQEKTTEIVLASRKFYDWADKEILEKLKWGGVLSEDGYKFIKSRNRYWFPFELTEEAKKLGDEFNVDIKPDASDFFPIAQNVIYGMRGAPKHATVKPPMETVLKRMSMAVGLAEKNKALLDTIGLAQKYPEFAGDNFIRVSGDETPPPNHGTFGVIVDGKVQKWSAPKDMIQGLKTLTPQDVTMVDKIFSRAKTMFTAGTTGYYLPFSVFNIPRDIQMAILTSQTKFSPVSWLNGLLNAFPSAFGVPTPLYKQYLDAHAGFGGILNRNLRLNVKDLYRHPQLTLAKETFNPVNLLKNIGSAFEMAPRMGTFREALKYGKEGFEAGMLARRSTIDFWRSGILTKAIGQALPFFNASVQAKATMMEALTSNKGIRGGKANVLGGLTGKGTQAALFKATTQILLPSMAIYFYNRVFHDDLYSKMNEDEKHNFLGVILGKGKLTETGGETIKYVPIPKDDLLKLVVNPLCDFFDWAWKKEPKKMSEVAFQWLNDWLPIDTEKEGKFNLSRTVSGVIPPVGKAVVEPITNRNLYFDRPIVNEKLSGVAPSEQYNARTGKLYRSLGSKFNLSPKLLEQGARNLFGSVALAPTPEDMASRLAQRIVRQSPTSTTSKAYDLEEKIGSGYRTTRLKAERLMTEGKESGAYQAMIQWNKDAESLIEQMATLVGKDAKQIRATAFYKQYTFQNRDFASLKKSIAEKKVGAKTNLEKKLRTTIR